MATAHADVVGEVWRLTIAAKYPDDQWQLPSFHLQALNVVGGDSKHAVCGQMDSLIATHVLPMLSTNVVYYGARMSPAYTTPPWQPYVTVPAQTGTGTGACGPTQARPLISLGTEKSGREWRGRFYCFTPATVGIDLDGSPTAGLKTAWSNVIDPWRATLSVGGTLWGMVLVHAHPDKNKPLQPVEAITSMTFNDKFATQKRSGAYGRPNSEPWIL